MVRDILSFPTPREVKHVVIFGLGGLLPPLHQGIRQDCRPPLTATDQGCLLHLVRRTSASVRYAKVPPDIKLLTDHRPLSDSKSPNGRQARWIDTLLEFNPVILYTLGALNKVADSLSHIPTLHLDVLDKEDVKSRQHQDPTYVKLIDILEADPSAPLPRRPHVPTSDLYLEDDLFRRSSPHGRRGTKQRHTYKQLVIPEDLVPTILRLLHEAPTASHAGADKAIKFARERYFFARMASRITEHFRRYQVCPLH